MKAYKTLLFILFTITLLALLCVVFPKEGIAFGERRLFFPTLEEIMVREKGQSAAEKLQAMEESFRMQVYQDSLANAELMAFNDSLQFYVRFFENHPARIHLPENDLTFLNSLFYNLDNCKEKKEILHILHYGDSQIEGDRISGFIRQQLQEKFGGNGPGLLPIVQPIPSAAVGQTASENINRYTVAGNHINRASHNRYGVLGQVAEIYGNASISVIARNWSNTFENVKQFSKIRLFVNNNAQDFKATLTVSGKEPQIRTIEEGDTGSNILVWDMKEPIKRFTLNLSGRAEITGISVDGDHGVAVDNIPLRGSSGTFFTGIDANSLVPVLKELNVRLILLEFGGNMMPVIKGEKNVSAYKENMAKQIVYFRQIYPDAKLLLIGPADMSTKVNGRLQSYPYLKETIQGMREAALENGAAFWDMYEVMGGENSMIDWVNNKPALAAPDYVHFTPRGANRIAELFCESLMMYYDYYTFMNNSTISNSEIE